ncbi:DUF726-domain-containing protein [Sistotremastrum suecicum HHB10207 ss-3]|uniref:DUF726-domain-containing protein n=1 Tax=Sistotremastrum suecicum HHB10207 ss-3 TaxID=1314776 RepID=A0A166CZ34_9AGAM|nr:DUF726-domain-containing protein [Sistotremastrum suecicum HHB10207 ss-3]
MSDLAKIVPPKELDQQGRNIIFEHVFRRLATYRNGHTLYAAAEQGEVLEMGDTGRDLQSPFEKTIDEWANALLKHVWAACDQEGECTPLDPLTDTSLRDLPRLPDAMHVSKVMSTVLFLHVATSKEYSAHTRSFIFLFSVPDEDAIVATLKNPEKALGEAEKQASQAKAKEEKSGRMWRRIGVGAGAVAGGVLIGVTGGLAAPLVGAGIGTFLGAIGVGGTAAGLLATGLASSSVVCGALFGAYGARSTAGMVGRHTKEVQDFEFVSVREPRETLAVRICISGWLDSREDVKKPWTVFKGDDTFALQWEIEALEALSNALGNLVKSNAIKYVRLQILKRTVLASLLAGLSPLAMLKLGQIVDNPWSNAVALAVKTGRVLGLCLASRAFGTRPVTLVGYSLGSLVIFEALKYLASLPVEETFHLIQDVYLFGLPAPTTSSTWKSVRRVVAGRFVNGYAGNDYILAFLSRVTDIKWEVAGLTPVAVQGIENVEFEDVDGHLKWRGMIGKCLQRLGVDGIDDSEVQIQNETVGAKIAEEMDKDLDEANMDEASRS